VPTLGILSIDVGHAKPLRVSDIVGDGMKVAVPALYIAGDHDMVVASSGAAEQITNMKQVVPLLSNIQMLPRCGHWTQQERHAEVSAAIIEFLRGLPK
jgi:pimeloyl-ACP methyl ester carboxylesterase